MRGADITGSRARAGGPAKTKPSAFGNSCGLPGQSACFSGHGLPERELYEPSEKIYRLLLRAYPRAYRDRYAQPMEQLFRDRLREVSVLPDFLALWRRMLADWLVSLPGRYWEQLVPHGHPSLFAAPARRCLFFARSEASSFSRREITVEHLLLRILREESSLLSGAARKP